MTIQAIINNTLIRLKKEGKLLTPDFYSEAFCKEAKKVGMDVEDCNKLDTYKHSLSKEFQKDLKNYNIKTINELIRFLIAKLNRTNPTQLTQMIESQTLLTKRILQVITVLHNKEAADLARNSLEILELGAQTEQLNNFRQRWVNFLTNYDDTFLLKLKGLGDIDSKDLQKSVASILQHSSQNSLVESVDSLEKVSQLLIASFIPSIASSVNDTIEGLSNKIRKNPAILENVSIEKEIKNAISLRIALDKDSVKKMIVSIDSVLDKLSLHLVDMIDKSDSSNVTIERIKKELESYTEASTTNFKTAHKKLYTIAAALEENTQLLSSDLKTDSHEVSALSKRVKKLEKELEAAKKESTEDFLTKLKNRRALDDFLELKEAEYKRYGRNFSVAMFDIDKFKNVNDTYGHDAGDAILTALAKILKKESRSADIVGRFGGEEFLALLSDTDIVGSIAFGEKVRKQVEKARFMYNGKHIAVTISCGLSERKNYVSASAALNSADEYLYVAKTSGRNRVEYKK